MIDGIIVGANETLHKSTLKIVKHRLEVLDGNKTQTAKSLGVSLRSLRVWVRENDELKMFRRELKPCRKCGALYHNSASICRKEISKC